MNRNQIKGIAIIAMTIDHLGWLLFPGLSTQPLALAMHLIGRLTAPIMWYFIAEGAHYTHDIRRYRLRLGLFALLSHFAFAFAFGIPLLPFQNGLFNQTSVLWPLFLAVVVISVLQKGTYSGGATALVIATACLLAFPADWSSIAVVAPMYLYLKRGDFRAQSLQLVIWIALYTAIYVLFIDRLYGLLQLGTLLTIPILRRYKSSIKTDKRFNRFFYWYFPLHMLVIGLLRLWIYGDVALIF